MYTTICLISVAVALVLSLEYIRAKYVLRPLKKEFDRLVWQQEEQRKLPRLPRSSTLMANSVIDRLKSIERERDLLEVEIQIYLEDFAQEQNRL